MRKTISIDFDGVIHLDDGPWIAPGVMSGRINLEAVRFILTALEAGWDVVVHSCRFYDLGATEAVRRWLHREVYREAGFQAAHFIHGRLQYSLSKPRARIYIDDRGFRFEGRFPQLEDVK